MKTEKGEAQKQTRRIGNLRVGLHDMSKISGNELGKYDTSS